MTSSIGTRREEALAVAEELLGEIELGRLDPVAIARKAGRLARLLDDIDAMRWLSYETTGYPGGQLDADAWRAAGRSCRTADTSQGPRATTTSLGQLGVEIDAAMAELHGAGGDVSDSQYAVIVERNKAERLNGLRAVVGHRRQLLDKVVGAIHRYVADRYQELRFGSAVETAFSIVRTRSTAQLQTSSRICSR